MSDVEPAAEEEAVPIDIWLSRQRVGRDELWREIVRSPVWHGDVPAARTLECSEATFDEGLAFDKAHIDRASFADATFEGDVHLSRIFAVELNLPRVTIHGELRLRWCMLDRLDLTGATVDGPVVFTDVGARRIVLDAATFGAPVRADISAEVVTCGRATFDGGLDLNVRWAEVDLEETSFGQPSVVAFLDKELPVATPLAERLHEEGRADRPRIVSLRRANVDGLLLSGVDLRACRFVKAHSLDRLRLENDVLFAQPRRGKWVRRRVISEEAHWRAEHQGGAWKKFYELECRPPTWLVTRDPRLETAFDASLVATIYRALRKGREDAKDEPGAADFYYGEMEMRRHSRTGPYAERAILWLYWLVAGYGLRASRAFAALVAAVVAFAVALDLWGFDPDRGFGHALLVSVQSTTSLLRGISEPLTTTGEWAVTALRLLGPLLLGLMILSLRGRVKR